MYSFQTHFSYSYFEHRWHCSHRISLMILQQWLRFWLGAVRRQTHFPFYTLINILLYQFLCHHRASPEANKAIPRRWNLTFSDKDTYICMVLSNTNVTLLNVFKLSMMKSRHRNLRLSAGFSSQDIGTTELKLIFCLSEQAVQQRVEFAWLDYKAKTWV